MFEFRTLARALSAAAIVALVAGCSGGSGGSAGPAPVPATTPGRAGTQATDCATKQTMSACIKKVVVILLENRSFDNLFHFLDPTKANIATSGSDHGKTIMLGARSFTESSDAGHGHGDFVKQFDGGLNDGWGDDSTDATKGRAYEYGYLPQSEVAPYTEMANQYAVSDNFFHGVQAPTFPSHIEIGAGTTFGVYDNPSVGIPWGCDAAAGTTTGSLNPDGTINPKGPFPCFDGLSLFDLLDRKGVTWRYYSEPEGQSISGNLVIPAAFRSTRYGLDWNTKIAKADTEVDAAITTGTLPQVSFVIPDSASTDHAGTPSQGPMYVQKIANELGSGKMGDNFDNTLLIVTWDDWGGWYDHVVPPTVKGDPLSYRKPIIFLNSYVKYFNKASKATGYVSHVQTEDASIAKTLESIYGLDSLGTHDARASDFADVFDFAQTPRSFTTLVAQEIASPTSANPNFMVRAAAILGKHDGKAYDVNAYYKAKAVDY